MAIKLQLAHGLPPSDPEQRSIDKHLHTGPPERQSIAALVATHPDSAITRCRERLGIAGRASEKAYAAAASQKPNRP